MKNVMNRFVCLVYLAERVTDGRIYECPECHSENAFDESFLICDCGREVYVDGPTRVCECGKYYNGFGQELAPPEEWDEEERYSCFGPDCLEDC